MKNIVHQADQIIRKLISGKIEELKGNSTPFCVQSTGLVVIWLNIYLDLKIGGAITVYIKNYEI